jgi:hypothetical protein
MCLQSALSIGKETCEICLVDLRSVNSVGRSEEAVQRIVEQQQLQLNEGLHTALAQFACFHSLRDAGALHSVSDCRISTVNRRADS